MKTSIIGYVGYNIFKNFRDFPVIKYKFFGWFRVFFARQFIAKCGNNVVIEKGADFGKKLKIGNNSGIGVNAWIRGDVTIGDNVLMAPNVIILTQNHKHDRTDIPILLQGITPELPVIIEDDCWICQNVIILPGVIIKRGSIIAAGSVVTKNVPEFSIVGGNPGQIIKKRKTL